MTQILRQSWVLLFCCSTLLFTSHAVLAATETLYGRVVKVSDGDTLTLLTAAHAQIKVRMAEIDAPEKKQAYGQSAKESLSSLIFDQQVTVIVDNIDRYGRSVGHIRLGNMDVNAEQIRRGFAWVYLTYSHNQNLINLQKQAKNAGRGLWRDAAPVAPWDFRREQKKKKAEIAAALAVPDVQGFSCDTPKRRCNDMASCEEATFYLNTCGLHQLDGDNDGVPCVDLCR